MKKFPPDFFLTVLFLSAVLAHPLLAEEHVSTAIHIHSDFSSGAKPILEIAKIADRNHVEAVILTDHLYERYEYGVWPFQAFLKRSYERESVLKRGVENFLQTADAASKNTGTLVIEGITATPFYYWSGSLWKKPLVLNDRGKDLLVFGAGDSKVYENMPVTARGNSGFSAYQGEKYSAPYQKFIDYANQNNLPVFWSHPFAGENYDFKTSFGFEVVLNSPSYTDDVLATYDYTGIGVTSVELAMANSPGQACTPSPGGIWDQVLIQYARGERKSPAWVIGEIDFNGYPEGNRDIAAILNHVIVPSKSRENILSSLKRGRVYLTVGNQRLRLDSFSARNKETDGKAVMGELLEVNGLFDIQINLSSPQPMSSPVTVMIIRNGEILEQRDAAVPFSIHYEDPDPLPGISYYRLLIFAEDGTRLLSNPIFVKRR